MASRSCHHNKLILYSAWISSCAFRVRFGLNLKGLQYEYKAVAKGDLSTPEFRKLNPIGLIPVLVDEDNVVSDSFAILMYLEEKYPQHPLLPADLNLKAINYQKFIEDKLGPDEKLAWVQHHIGNGFSALEKLLRDYAGKYATGNEVFLADLFLAPQIHAAINRFNLDMTEFPLLLRLHDAYSELPAFQNAVPEKQPDAPSM